MWFYERNGQFCDSFCHFTRNRSIRTFVRKCPPFVTSIGHERPDPSIRPMTRIGWRRSGGSLAAIRKDTFRCQDRKSTRLNSSHVAISYAVFCLKKKLPILRPLPARHPPAYG